MKVKLSADLKKEQIRDVAIDALVDPIFLELAHRQSDAVEELSNILAREIDKEVLNGIIELNRKDNIELIKEAFGNKGIDEVCKELKVKDLGREWNLKAKIRDWKINKFLD